MNRIKNTVLKVISQKKKQKIYCYSQNESVSIFYKHLCNNTYSLKVYSWCIVKPQVRASIFTAPPRRFIIDRNIYIYTYIFQVKLYYMHI